MLAAGQGSRITIEADVADAEAAIAAILNLIAGKFGEQE